MNRLKVVFFFVLLLALCTTAAWAQLPDLPRQELWIKIVSAVVGLVVIFSVCMLGVTRLLYGLLSLEAEMATRFSIILGIILSFLWFLYLFGQIFSTTITIAMVTLGVIVVIVILLRGSDGAPKGGGESGDGEIEY